MANAIEHGDGDAALNIDRIRSVVRRILFLGALYFVQGLPFGFQASALPLYLRERGASLTTISFAGALALPWMLKALWAPLVDRYGSVRFGRRRGWILAMQVLMIATAGIGGLVVDDYGLRALLAIVFFMNLFAATLDIAVDGLAVDILQEHHLGYGNTAQVVGYKLGMLTGGGLLVWWTQGAGCSGLLFAMCAMICVVFLMALAFSEPRVAASGDAIDARIHRAEFWSRIRKVFARPGVLWVVAMIATYKLGESMADMLFRPFLLDSGYSVSQLGLLLGSWGMVFSIVGSLAGGWLASRTRIVHALAIIAVARVVPLVGQWLLSMSEPLYWHVVWVTCAEHFVGGALTTVMFAFMMAQVDRKIGATHYTILATIEVAGKAPGGYLAGLGGDAFGYAPMLGLAALLSIAFLVLLPFVKKVDRRRRQGSAGDMASSSFTKRNQA